MSAKTLNLTKDQEAALCKSAVCNLLAWSDLEYCNMQYERGLEYLHYYLQGDQWGIDQIHRCKVFWTWWKNHWVQRDWEFMVYLQVPDILETLSEKRKFYSLTHNADDLSRSIYPSGQVLQDTYAHMKRQIFDQQNA